MAKTHVTRRRTRQSEVVTSESVEEEDNTNTVVSEGQPETDSSGKQSPVENTEMKQDDDQNDQDSQMDTVIEVKGSTSTVTVSWSKNGEEAEADGTEKRSSASDQMMDGVTTAEEQIISSADAVVQNESTETKKKKRKRKKKKKKKKNQQEMQESGESQVDAVTAEKSEEDESDDIKEEANGAGGKRKAVSPAETSPSKKAKLANDGFCVFVGNLNTSKTFDEVRDSLANYLMAQSLLVQDLRLSRSRKHAHVELASEMDFTKALTLNGNMILEKPMKVAKARTSKRDKVKVEVDVKATRNGRCLFLKNVPYSATKEDIVKVFPLAVAVRFPSGAESPDKGIAFVEFKDDATAEKVRQQKEPFAMQGRVLIVDTVGKSKAQKDSNPSTKAAAAPSNILFVSNLPFNVKEKQLKKVFEKAVGITIPQNKGKQKGYALVKFATVAEAEKTMKTTQNTKVSKQEVRVQFFEKREKSEKSERSKGPSKTLMVVRLAEKTTAETLKSAFEGALAARVATNKETGASKRFGFVDFESEEDSKAAKKAMEDCEIDGSKVVVVYANPTGAKGGVEVHPAGQPAGRGAGKGGRNMKGGKKRGAVKTQAAVKDVENKG